MKYYSILYSILISIVNYVLAVICVVMASEVCEL